MIALALLYAALQRTAESAMAGRAGAAVVLDVHSGRILASYHLDVAGRRLTRPGSVVKPFTLLATTTPPRKLICARKLQIGTRQMDCSHPPAPDAFDAVAALAYSCNYYFATLAAGLRGSDLVEAFTRAGLTSRTGLYAGEAVGEITPPSTVEQRQLLALGESNILVTPLELVCGA
jgi:cell division protein FtsI/penicillin-binding protein 2